MRVNLASNRIHTAGIIKQQNNRAVIWTIFARFSLSITRTLAHNRITRVFYELKQTGNERREIK